MIKKFGQVLLQFNICVLLSIALFLMTPSLTAEAAEVNYKTLYAEDTDCVYWVRHWQTNNISVFNNNRLLFNMRITNKKVYATDTVWLRSKPTIAEGNELTVSRGTVMLELGKSTKGWSLVKYEDKAYFVWNEYIAQEPVYDETDLRYLSSIIWAEAGNQCEAGKQAVGIIVINRTNREDAFADTVQGVIYERGQFSPISNGSMDTALNMYDNGTLPQECIDAAKYALSGIKIVTYNGSDIDLDGYYFFSRYVRDARITIQDHDFK